MSRDTLIFSGPVATRSGYGAHARDILKSLKDMNRFDIEIVSMRWGSCPMNALEDDNEFHQWIKDKIVINQVLNTPQKLTYQPDVWVQMTVPNEFQRVGKYNIGITAGIETTAVPHEWINGMNQMDLNLVPSTFTKEVFEGTSYDQQDENGNVVNTLKVNKPIEVLFEGFDSNTYFNTNEISDKLENELNIIEEDFCFLFVGHWLSGDFGHDRKDVATLVKTFGEAFRNKGTKPALVLKTSHATTSVIDKQNIYNRIKRIKEMVGKNCPPIYLIHGNLSDEEMNQLYNHPKMKTMVSFTKGEGFGRPLLEFSITGKPVIASNFSGHLDFLDEKYSILLPGQLSKVHNSVQNNFVVDGSGWFYVDFNAARDALKDVYKNYKKYRKKSETLGNINSNKFTLDKMTEKFSEILDKNLPKFPKEKEFKLPNLPDFEKVE